MVFTVTPPSLARSSTPTTVKTGVARAQRRSQPLSTVHPNTGSQPRVAGLDAGVDPDSVGAVLQLRFGPERPQPGSRRLRDPGGIALRSEKRVRVLEAEREGGKLTFILGKFDTVYGEEVRRASSTSTTRAATSTTWRSRSSTPRPPRRRASHGGDGLKLLAVNGWNNTIDNNRGKSFGASNHRPACRRTVLRGRVPGGPEETDVERGVCARPRRSMARPASRRLRARRPRGRRQRTKHRR